MKFEKLNDGFIRRLTSNLEKVGYKEEGLSLMGIQVAARYLPKYKLIFDNRLRHEGVLGQVIKLFFFGDSVDPKSLNAVISPRDLTYLKAAGIIAVSGLKIYSNIKLTPFKGYYFASDFVTRYEKRGQKKIDLVFPVSLDSLDLINATLDFKSKRTLDLCSGSGVQAILSSASSKKVTGVDINPRAIEFAGFNARLNGIRNVEFLLGDLYGPIGNAKFDRILSNPPYETTARTKVLFGDGGSLGRNELGEVIKRLPEFLDDKGVCQIVTKFFLKEGETVKSVIGGYLGNGNYRILYLEKHLVDIYEEAFAQYSGTNKYETYKGQFDKLVSDFVKLGINRVSYGVVTIKRDKKPSYAVKNFSPAYSLPITPSRVVKGFFSGR